MSLGQSLLKEFKTGLVSPEDARSILDRVSGRFTTQEVADLLAEITRIDATRTVMAASLPQLFSLIPDGWLKDYVTYAQISEAPDSFHFFVAVGVLTNLLGKRIKYVAGPDCFYVPMNIFLVSPAGQARRSEAINTIIPIAREAGGTVLDGSVTPEGLVGWLKDNPQTLLFNDEAAGILSNVEYMKDMPRLLCQAMDMRPLVRKLRGEMIDALDYTFSCVLGCAPSWIREAMPKSALEGGLFSRLIFVYEESRQRLHPIPYENMDAMEIERTRTSLAMLLAELIDAVAPGTIKFSPGARSLWIDNYGSINREMRTADDKMAIYFSRKPSHVIRLAVALQVAAGKGIVITEDYLTSALAIMHLVELKMPFIYEEVGMERAGIDRRRVLNIMRKAGGSIAHSELLTKISKYIDTKRLEQIAWQLVEEKKIKIMPDVVQGTKVKRMYILIEE